MGQYNYKGLNKRKKEEGEQESERGDVRTVIRREGRGEILLVLKVEGSNTGDQLQKLEIQRKQIFLNTSGNT